MYNVYSHTFLSCELLVEHHCNFDVWRDRFPMKWTPPFNNVRHAIQRKRKTNLKCYIWKKKQPKIENFGSNSYRHPTSSASLSTLGHAGKACCWHDEHADALILRLLKIVSKFHSKLVLVVMKIMSCCNENEKHKTNTQHISNEWIC